jgi:hypothetical protein
MVRGRTVPGWLPLLILPLGSACSGATPAPSGGHATSAPADAPLVASQPGAWFDAQGNLTVVGAGRRLRLVLSAPVSACSPAFSVPGKAADVAARASLPFHVLAEACRQDHPTILLPAESEGASPAELEHSYHDVSRCAASELGVTEGWVPQVVADGNPCLAALGLGWRLPSTAELTGLTLDDRKAIAGALFDTQVRTTFGSLVVYARSAGGALELATLSPNAAEQAPALDDDKRQKPLFGAALRCVRDAAANAPAPAPPPQPYAAACLKEQRSDAGLTAAPRPSSVPELQKLKAWLDVATRNPVLLGSDAQLRELMQLLAAPALDQLARDAREERALTERYAELAEGLDDPGVSATERERRRTEFDSLRKRLGGQIVSKAETAGASRTELAAVLQHLQLLLERHQLSQSQVKKRPHVDYSPALTRVRELGGNGAKASTP